MGLEGLWGSRVESTESQGVSLQGPRRSRGGPYGSQGVKRWAYSHRVPGGHGVGLQVPRGPRFRPTGS